MHALVFLPPATLSRFGGARRSTVEVELSRARRAPHEQVVADSADPYGPLFYESSAAVSEVAVGRHGVPWEELHVLASPPRQTQAEAEVEVELAEPDYGQPRSYARSKRVRITSPVLVIETPERTRGFEVENTPSDPVGPTHPTTHPEPRWLEDEAETSRVVLDASTDYDDDECDEDDAGNRGEQGGRTTPEVLAALGAARYASDASVEQQSVEAEATVSVSSLQIRAPVPARQPAPTCRFTFFAKRPSLAPSHPTPPSIVVQSAPSPTDSELNKTSEASEVNKVNRARTVEVGVGEDSLRGLPVMNAHGVSLSSLGGDGENSAASEGMEGMESILPRATLGFSLAQLTPLARILAHPTHFLATPRPRYATETCGATSHRVQLLVVIKDVGELVRVRSNHTGPTRVGGDGKVDVVELVVMDGWIAPVPLRGSQGQRAKVEKQLLKVVLWADLATTWTSVEQGATTSTGSSAVPTVPTALRAGDVVFLENLVLARQTSYQPPARRSRLGTGFPPRDASAAHERISLVAHAAPHHASRITLCYRSHVLTPSDRQRNFDPDLAAFDPKSRRILDLVHLYQS